MSPAGPAALLPQVIRLARAAGRAIRAVDRAGYEVFEKPDRSPVTTADFAAHRVIEAGLAALDPARPALSEEGGIPPWRERRHWTEYWLVDPLDGTRELLARRPEYTVNIALLQDGRPALGVVYAPALDELYYACRDGGAWRVDGGGEPRPARSRVCPAGTPLKVAARHRYASPPVRTLLERLAPVAEFRLGSSLKSCRVACGELDLYPRHGPTSEWDTAAAQCVVEEAGGCMLDWRGRALRYNRGPSLRNPPFLAAGDPARDWAALTAGLAAREA